MEIELAFDRPDRRYRFGDEVTGKVILRNGSGETISKVWLTRHWRTHGKGNRDKGGEETETLMEERSTLPAGEQREFAFHFRAPDGPASYHGHFLNVDWYLTARAKGGGPGSFKDEQDFLLLGGPPTGPLVLGKKEIALSDLPMRPADLDRDPHGLPRFSSPNPAKRRPWWMGGLGLLGYGLLCILFFAVPAWLGDRLGSSFLWPCGLVAAAVALSVLVSQLHRNAYRRKFELGEAWVSPSSLYPGGQVRCHVDFRSRREFHLRAVKATLSATERVTYTSGTTTVTEAHVLHEKIHVRPFDEDVAPDRVIAFDCVLPIIPEAPASFSANSNDLVWAVTLKADLKGWPDWEKSFPITVLP